MHAFILRIDGLRSRKLRRRVGHLVLHLAMVALSIAFLMPLAWVASTSLKAPGQVFITPIEWIPETPRWRNYAEVFQRLPFTRFIINSFFVTTMGTLGAVLSATTVAFGLSRIRWPGRDILFAILIATLMLPGVVTLIPVFIIFKEINWVGTFYPLWVPAWLGMAFYIFLMRQYMLTLPIELDEAAKIDGASNFRILWQIIAPLCGPAITTVAIFAFLYHYNDFIHPLIYLSENEMFTLPLGLLWFQGRFGNFWHLVMAASMITISPVIVLFFIAQRYFVQGMQFTGLAGR
ncbi:MAG: sn-glycerol-3-phosphate transport system permease protein UgpE [Pirellulaceae bacterium]|nr:MAG: sn-glycerol-3-phosphate transport system permease protein UgpE [Pirellulaceae bacterium]